MPAGFEHLVDRIIRRTVHKINEHDPESTLRQLMGIKPCKGVLIYGPHGSGKSCLANRVAYESRSVFKFVSLSCAELVHKVFYQFYNIIKVLN
jgi:ATP-dependent 26S proteasome regulatory subunit